VGTPWTIIEWGREYVLFSCKEISDTQFSLDIHIVGYNLIAAFDMLCYVIQAV